MTPKLLLKIAAVVVVVVVLLGAGAYGWSAVVAENKLVRTIETHRVSFPVPFPLTGAELAELGVEDDEGGRIAMERAVERGRHLVEARYGCAACHGETFNGGTMIDAAPMGTILGPNITTGEGSVTTGYTAADWDRIVRHGVRRDGHPSLMPAQDFRMMSDQELSDIVAYLRSRPPMYGEVPPPSLGPIGKILVATGRLPLAADRLAPHDVEHASRPPAAAVSLEFGRHLAGVCVGCHGDDLAGGVVQGGDPGWPPAANLTPHQDGLADWTLDDFRAALTRAVRPDGTPLRPPMSDLTTAGAAMTDTEMRALWAYLQSIPPVGG